MGRLDEYTFYHHVSLPDHVVVEQQDVWYLVPDIAGGWKQRTLYRGYRESLRLIPLKEGMAFKLGLGHGGYREGSGREVLYEEKMRRVTVTLPQADMEYLKELGAGNLSAGVREAVDQLRKREGQ